jgi:hypothetical protein
LLEAAERLAHDPQILFCFIGGGSEFRKIQQLVLKDHRSNIFCLPYQAQEQLGALLSAADLQVVVMGDDFVGVVHPCKIYNLLNLGTPILYIGPQPSPVTQLLSFVPNACGLSQSQGVSECDTRSTKATFTESHPQASLNSYHACHGEIERIVQHIRRARSEWAGNSPRQELRSAIRFSRSNIIPNMVAHLETTS